MRTFGERLRELRLKKGLSQEAAAEKLEVSPQALSKWETDKCYPEFSLILPLARLFGVSADELLGNEDRRAWWEAKWRETRGNADRLSLAEEALKELPEDWQFRYRLGCTEYFMALDAGSEAEKRRWLSAAEKHLAALYADHPHDASASAAGMLVTVLTAMDRRQEAEELCRELPDGDGLLVRVLEGERLKEHRRKLLTGRVEDLILHLLGFGSREALLAAERLVAEVLGAEGLFADLLLAVRENLAREALKRSAESEAMAALEAVGELARTWGGAGGQWKTPEKAPFLAPHPENYEEHLWENLLAFLENPALDPLRDRPDFQALLAEAKDSQSAQE